MQYLLYYLSNKLKPSPSKILLCYYIFIKYFLYFGYKPYRQLAIKNFNLIPPPPADYSISVYTLIFLERYKKNC